MRAVSPTSPGWLDQLGDAIWIRAHISTFAIGTVILLVTNLLIGGSSLWAVTATGVWGMLLIAHGIVAVIARLATQLMADDDEDEIVLLPIRDAEIVEPGATPQTTTTWSSPIDQTERDAASTTDTNRSPVSWQVATDAARGVRSSQDTPDT